MDTTERILESTVETSYSYVYNGSQLVQEIIVTKTTVDDETTTETETLNYSYDASGTPMAVEYNGTTYYYATNLQGDITAILNTSGTAVVTYTYDAWGNPLTTAGTLSETLGESNTLRYRGYVYDSDTGLYYLQSRYYDPELGRFINADIYVATGQGLIGNNMFTYCLNNPIIYSDSSGRNAEALEYWITVMWWLCGVDMVLPFGDIIYSIGIIILLADAMSSGSETQETYKAAKEKAVSAASDMLDYASTAAPPHLHQTKAEREHKLPPDRFIPKTVKTAFALT